MASLSPSYASPDIKKYCIKEAEATLQSSFEQNGPVLHCLKERFAEVGQQGPMLSVKCYQRVRLVCDVNSVFLFLLRS
ncbi:unnamed protein product [Echinostoma caproni]|uniref:Dynein light chain n=1 Tax=Echinostoma caproni TaxID=27848 RepID=A0A183BCL0_9TREM|nr:unnamed protein product [Echinostoma caproni]